MEIQYILLLVLINKIVVILDETFGKVFIELPL